MNTEKAIQVEQRNSNLFIKLFGPFSKNSAYAVTNAISQQYNGTGNIFVNVEKVAQVQPCGQQTFRDLLDYSTVPKNKIYLIGKKGIEFGINDLRIIIRKQKKCCGNCKGCPKKAKKITPFSIPSQCASCS